MTRFFGPRFPDFPQLLYFEPSFTSKRTMTALNLIPALMALVPGRIVAMLILAFFAILFLQSGLDKITDRNANLDWLTGHFAKSPLKNLVPLLLTILTILEVFAGGLAALSSLYSIFMPPGGAWLPFTSMVISIVTLLALFAGQRIAKDYTGAAGIVPYFVAAVLGLILFADWL
jgi:hypothetical protein